MPKPLGNITKKYPKRGPLSQFRFEKSISFSCFRCGQIKTAKLITIYSVIGTKGYVTVAMGICHSSLFDVSITPSFTGIRVSVHMLSLIVMSIQLRRTAREVGLPKLLLSLYGLGPYDVPYVRDYTTVHGYNLC